MVKTAIRRFVILGLFGLLLFTIGFSLYKSVIRALYPIHFDTSISNYASANRLDPLFLASVIRIESGFDTRAQSSRNARGLMQIVPRTGRWIAHTLKIPYTSDDVLFNPDTNIRLGAWYLAYLKREFGSNLIALAAYNAGRGNVKGWLRSGKWDGTSKGLDNLPFLETRVYIRRVTNAHNWYKRIYHGKWPENP